MQNYKMEKKKGFKGEILLFITAIIWGTSFVSQKLGMNYVEPFTFGASRFLLGALVLIPVILIFDKKNNKDRDNKVNYQRKDLIKGGALCGSALFLGASFQQVGIVYTTAGKAGFITALYIILVPLFGLLFLKRKITKMVWIGVGLSTVGLYLLCIKEGFTIEIGDAVVMAGTIFWALQILFVDAFNDKTDGLKLSCAQFITAGTLSAIAALIFENPSVEIIIDCGGPILYTAIMVVGVAYTFQIIGQKTTDPNVAAIIMSMESLFAVISGALFLKETMNMQEILGCIFMFAAVILTQINPTKKTDDLNVIS